MQNFFDRLEMHSRNVKLRKLNYHSDKWKRSPHMQSQLDEYRQSQISLGYTGRLLFQSLFPEKYEKHKEIPQPYNEIHGEHLIEPFRSFISNNIELKNGDIVFILPQRRSSYQIALHSDSNYSHGGMIWVRNNEYFVIEMNPRSDLLIIPLSDYLLPDMPRVLALGIYRCKKPLDSDEVDYLFQQYLNNRDKLIFDPLFVNDPPFKNPENFMKSNQFLYCTEFIALSYGYLLGNMDFLSPYRVNLTKISENYIADSPFTESVVQFVQNYNEKKGQYIISYNNFTQSNDFETLLEIKGEKILTK